MATSYKGKIANTGSQIVKKLFGKVSSKQPKVVSGGDLRAKKSKK